LASGGDARMGGDDLDRLLGQYIVQQVQSRQEASPFDCSSVLDATRFPSFESYRRSALDRVRAKHGELEEKSELARRVYGKASDILREAERAKCALTQSDRVVVLPSTDDWPLKTKGQAPPGLRLEIEITRQKAGALYGPLFEECRRNLKEVLRDAEWSSDDVTCVLFTGQGSRVPELRQALLEEIDKERKSADLRVIEPDALEGFDCKRCVSMGAAIFGDSQAGGGGWLSIAKEEQSRLLFTLQSRLGPRFVDVKDLSAGAIFPIESTYTFARPTRMLVLYRSREAFVTFNFEAPLSEVKIVMRSSHDIAAFSGETRVEGVLA